jgi:hypothetical protein
MLVLGVTATLALGWSTAGCDSILGDGKASADGGGGCNAPTDAESSGEAARPVDAMDSAAAGGIDGSVDTQEIDTSGDVSGETSQLAQDSGNIDGGNSAIDMGRSDLGTQGSEVSADRVQRDLPDAVADKPVTLNQDAPSDPRTRDTADSQSDRAQPPVDLDTGAPDEKGSDTSPDFAIDTPTDASLAVLDAGKDVNGLPDAAASGDTPDDLPPPTYDTAPAKLAKQVAAGANHSCALYTDGTVSCWGKNSDGQSTPPPASRFSQIAADNDFNCGLKLDGSLQCWGNNSNGQRTPPTGHFLQVATGAAHACAIRTDGTVSCWGLNTAGQCLPPTGTFVQLAAGSEHSCGILTGGALACWGGNTVGQTVVPSGSASQLSAYGYHSCAVRSDSSVVCWGSNNHSESIPATGPFLQVSEGYWHSCAVRSNGSVACWGDNSHGQSTPVAGTFTQVGAGMFHTCALHSDGTVACWGDNSFGQLSPL